MSLRILFVLCCFGSSLLAQTDTSLIAEIESYRKTENERFSNPETTILEPKDLRHFNGLDFYPIDLTYRVTARFVRTPDEKPFFMPTTTTRLPEYVKYGEAHFQLEGKNLVLSLYQSTNLEKEAGYEDYLFLPLTDLTSGDGSYGGGRFLDTRIPKGDSIVLDFNKLYNPYCAYNKRYSCPIPPKENDLQIRIEAGVKDVKHL
ncbi:DUF1684 domain-containing protein [Altibacter sp.]|uniref:DUF1684 domain-containing protein n=1 Tax=Altibacter sp. TaxID=2024823 RepID=UPI000C8F35F7|nr:DUF1684 domain-containing protein [Altibacter sp.]MAP54170.1 hypothetical protein [Altibacter sp.]